MLNSELTPIGAPPFAQVQSRALAPDGQLGAREEGLEALAIASGGRFGPFRRSTRGVRGAWSVERADLGSAVVEARACSAFLSAGLRDEMSAIPRDAAAYARFRARRSPSGTGPRAGWRNSVPAERAGRAGLSFAD